jgi:hypothetical protein
MAMAPTAVKLSGWGMSLLNAATRIRVMAAIYRVFISKRFRAKVTEMIFKARKKAVIVG